MYTSNIPGRQLSLDEMYNFANLLLPQKRQKEMIKNTIEQMLDNEDEEIPKTNVIVDLGSDEIYGQKSFTTLTLEQAENDFFTVMEPDASKKFSDWEESQNYAIMDIVRQTTTQTIRDPGNAYADKNGDVDLSKQAIIYWICETKHVSNDKNRPSINYDMMDNKYVPLESRKDEKKVNLTPGNGYWTCLFHSDMGRYDENKDILHIPPKLIQHVRAVLIKSLNTHFNNIALLINKGDKLSDRNMEKIQIEHNTYKQTEIAIGAMKHVFQQIDTLTQLATSEKMKTIENGDFDMGNFKFFQASEYMAPGASLNTEDEWGDNGNGRIYGEMISNTNPVFKKMNYCIKDVQNTKKVFISNQIESGSTPFQHWKHRKEQWDYCLDCLALPEEKARDLLKRLKNDVITTFLRDAVILDDKSPGRQKELLHLFEDCLSFIVGEYYRFRQQEKICEKFNIPNLVLKLKPRRPVLENMLRYTYLGTDISLSTDILGVDDVEYEQETKPASHYWKQWGREIRILTFRTLVLYGFLKELNIGAALFNKNNRNSNIAKLWQKFIRHYPGAPVPSDAVGIHVPWYKFLRFSSEYFIPIKWFRKIWGDILLERRENQIAAEEMIKKVQNVLTNDVTENWDIAVYGNKVYGVHNITDNLNRLKFLEGEKYFSRTVLMKRYKNYLRFVSEFNMRYTDKDTLRLSTMNEPNINIGNIIKQLRLEHVRFVENGLPVFKVTKSDVYGVMAFIKTIQQAQNSNKKYQPSKLQLVLLANPLIWNTEQQIKKQVGSVCSIFQWQIHGIGESHKLEEWLNSKENIIPSFSNMKRMKEVPIGLVKKLAWAIKSRRSVDHQRLNEVLEEYEKNKKERVRILKDKYKDDELLKSQLERLKRLNEDISNRKNDLIQNDDKQKQLEKKLEELRKEMEDMTKRQKYV